MTATPTSVLSRELLPASIAIFATSALASFQALGIAAALPDIAGDLGDVALLPWAITAFLVTSSLATVIAGPFIDGVGASRLFRIAVLLFASMGFLSGFAPSMSVLIGLRALQGVGAGLIMSTGTAAVSLVYPSHLVSRAFAANATVWGIMGVAGPAIAAAILTVLTWHWIFFVNLPLGLLALWAGWKVLPGPYAKDRDRVDLTGIGLLALVTVALLLAVDRLNLESLLWVGVAGLAVALYVRHARRFPSPVVRPQHVMPQPLKGLALATALMLTGTFAMNSYIPLYVRAGKLGSAGLTAWSVLPLTVGWTVGATVSSRMADRYSESLITVLGFVVNIPALIAVWVLVGFDAPIGVLFVLFFLAGVGVGMTTNAALTLMRTAAKPSEMGRVSAAHLFARNQGFTFGAAIGGAVLLFVVSAQLGDPELVRELIGASAAVTSPESSAAVRSGFGASVGAGAVFSGLGVAAALSMRRALAESRQSKRSEPSHG